MLSFLWYHCSMPAPTTTPVRTASKDALARLMATENLTIVHDPSSPTAYFNTLTRTLTLPVFKSMSSTVYDLLVSHEVGHALYTPADEKTITDSMDSIDARSPERVHDYLNMVEDARIERMIKSEFPGLARTYSNGYAEMLKNQFFGPTGADFQSMPLIDRLNMMFKPGLYGHLQLTFTDQEACFLKMMRETETWEDVVNVARELYDFVTQPPAQPLEPQTAPKPTAGPGKDDGSDADGQNEDEGEAGQGSGTAQGENEEEGEKTPTLITKNGQNEVDQADGEQKIEDGASSGGSSKGTIDAPKTPAPQSQTANASKQTFESMRDKTAVAAVNYKMPTADLDNIVIDYKIVHAEVSQCRKGISNKSWEGDKLYKRFMLANKDYVATLIKDFERKQAADESRRTTTARSGSLDMSRVHNYKFSDDLFLKSSFVSDGKNHGMVMFIDWSGSMSGILEKTLHQVMNLIAFCNATKIPFEVYAFNTGCSPILQTKLKGRFVDGIEQYKQAIAAMAKEYTVSPSTPTDNGDVEVGEYVSMSQFILVNLCSSRMNKTEMREGLHNLAFISKAHGSSNIPAYLWLGGTPLDECMIAAIPLVNQFRKASGVQIVNTILLTDGQGGGCPFHRNSSHTPITVRGASGHTYTIAPNQNHSSFIRSIFRGETHSSLTGFFLDGPGGNGVYQYVAGYAERQTALESFRKNNHFVATDKIYGYDNMFVINALTAATSKIDLDGDLAASFLQGNVSKKMTRAILTKFTDTICKDFSY